jgi:unsaturated chondroitin disaccharide hydrolase
MHNRLNSTQQEWVRGMWMKITQKMSVQSERVGAIFPYIAVDGKYSDKALENPYWWCNGFWPGILWLLHKGTGEAKYKDIAEKLEERFDEALAGYEGLHHDVGFQWTLSALANYRHTANPRSRVRALHAASLLAGRYNPRGNFIRSWNREGTTGWIIVDCMMNLPLLYWASNELDDPRFRFIAIEHAQAAMRCLVREDGSCNHIAVLDPENGDMLESLGGQGYAAGTSWTRGQAWALYGFTLSFLHSGEQRYLDAAKRIAHYFIANVALSGWVSAVDFRSPAEPIKIDTTASMCAACGMLEIAKHVGGHEKALYTGAAVNILKACTGAYANWNPDEDAVMGMGSGHYHGHEDQFHVPLIYGDYFFVEAILRLQNKDFLIW